ncbi:MAG: nodulation protein NfeD [Clostridiaceae bacterium]|nr:nodulation protein NfeD [Clostridiaceae bacterium]
MTRAHIKPTICLLLLFMILMLPAGFLQAQAAGPVVRAVLVDGEITPAMAAYLTEQIDLANDEGAIGLLLEIRTLGGQVDAAIQMRDAMVASSVPVAVYIESRAISAGALIAIAADTIVMAPGSHMGAAKPIPDDPKTVAFVSGEFRSTAEKNNRNTEIAMAMVDETIAIEGLVAAGEILDLTAQEAKANGYADHLASGRAEALKALGWDSATLVQGEMNFRHRIAQFLSSYTVASILLTVGMLALIAELFTPGFGVAGTIGIISFALYFTSGYLAGYTELWSAAIFLAGIVLIIIEIIVPGFGIFGISGLIALVVGVVFSAPTVGQGILTLLIALGATVAAVPILSKLFGKSRLIQRMVLSHAETVANGYVHTRTEHDLTGQTGVALTDLRPAGVIRIGNERVDALTEGDYIARGATVTVARVQGSKVFVTTRDESEPGTR